MSTREQAPDAALDETSATENAIELIEALAAEPASHVSAGQTQRIFSAAFQLYWNQVEAGSLRSPFTNTTRATATQVAHVALHLLRHQNLEIFELAAWQSWGGEPWSSPVWQRASHQSAAETVEEAR